MAHAKPTFRPSAGFTLVEVLLASAVLAFVVAALTQAIVAGQMQTYASIEETRSLALAESMMDEVLARRYPADVGNMGYTFDVGETSANLDRTALTSIGDYHNFTQTPNGQSDMAGALLPSVFQDYTRSVNVVQTTLNVSDLGGNHTGIQIAVTVTDANGRTYTLTRWVPQEAS